MDKPKKSLERKTHVLRSLRVRTMFLIGFKSSRFREAKKKEKEEENRVWEAVGGNEPHGSLLAARREPNFQMPQKRKIPKPPPSLPIVEFYEILSAIKQFANLNPRM